jgi:hypothetical protein
MIHPPSVGCRLLVAVLLLRGLLIPFLRTIVGIMARFTAVVAYIGSARRTSLHGGIIRCPLSQSLPTTLLLVLLPLMLELVTLRVLAMIHLTERSLKPLMRAML